MMKYAVSRLIPGVKPRSIRILEGSLRELTALFREEVAVEALRPNGWNITRAARELGVQRTYLHKLMLNLRLTRPDEFGARPRAQEVRP